MSNQKSQFQTMVEDILPDDVERLLHDAFASFDRKKVERFVRDQMDQLDTDKIEELAREVMRELDTEKLKHLLQRQLGNFDKDKLEKFLHDGARQLDRRKLEDRVRDQIKTLDFGKIRRAALVRLAALDTEAFDSVVRERAEVVVREQLKNLSPRELRALARGKQRDLRRLARSTKRDLKRQTKEARKTLAGGATAVARTADKTAAWLEPAESRNPVATVLGAAGRFAVLSAVGWIAYSHFMVDHQMPLPKAFPAEQMTLAFKPTGPLNMYVDRQASGRPLLLVHSVNAAASSYEMRPLFLHYRSQRPVYALDLPGYGFSARPKADYTPEVFVQAILAAVAAIDGGPVDVITFSLGSEFVGEAAKRKPELFHSLVLLSPSGMVESTQVRGSQGAAESGLDAWVLPFIGFPLWGRPLFDLLTVRKSIAYFLQKSFIGTVPQEWIDYAYKTSHQPGAEHAPFAFISGKLFTANATDRIYHQVTSPTLVVYDRDAFVSFDRLPELLAAHTTWQAIRIAPTLGLAHWERTEETTAALESFWKGLD